LLRGESFKKINIIDFQYQYPYHTIGHIPPIYMKKDLPKEIQDLYLPDSSSHKGQNGRLLIIGGSRLFHAASFWSLKVASRIVDLVHYSSIEENNRIVQRLKEEFRDGIVVPRVEIESYINEDDCILIGPGMIRAEEAEIRNSKFEIRNLADIESINSEGLQTYHLTRYLLQKYPHKKWVIDAGALQMLDPDWIPKSAILTPHKREFKLLKLKTKNIKLPPSLKLRRTSKTKMQNAKLEEQVKLFAKEHDCTILLKGEVDYISSPNKFREIKGGNAGMTKGGTGDVLAGLVSAFYCKNDAFTASVTASYVNKKAGDDLFEKMGYWFNASDLTDQIPVTMKKLVSEG